MAKTQTDFDNELTELVGKYMREVDECDRTPQAMVMIWGSLLGVVAGLATEHMLQEHWKQHPMAERTLTEEEQITKDKQFMGIQDHLQEQMLKILSGNMQHIGVQLNPNQSALDHLNNGFDTNSDS